MATIKSCVCVFALCIMNILTHLWWIHLVHNNPDPGHKKLCVGFTTACGVMFSPFLILLLGGSLVMNRHSDNRDVSAQCFQVSEPHWNTLGHCNSIEVVLLHFKCLQLFSTHFMLIKIAGVFCNGRSPFWWWHKEYKGCLSKGLLQSMANKSSQSQNLSTSQKSVQTAEQSRIWGVQRWFKCSLAYPPQRLWIQFSFFYICNVKFLL